jgi:alpha-1,6-mannosyltransferase
MSVAVSARAEPGGYPRWLWRWRVDPYWVVSGLLLLVAVASAVHLPWQGDLGMHAATVERLRASFTDPGNPLVDAPGPSPYYSPYTVLLAGLGRLTGWSTLTVLAIAGPVNIAVLLYGLRAFVTTLSARRPAPLLALLFVLGLWGLKPRVWSGFFSLWAMPLTMSWPSTLALGLTLVFWAALARTLDRPVSGPRYLGLGLLGAVVALTHQFTFAIAALGALALIAVRARRLPRTAWVWLGVAAVELVGLLLVWPYYSFFALFGVGDLDRIHTRLYHLAWLYYGLVVVALPALWLRWRRDRLDPLVLLFAGSLVIVAAGWVTGHYALGRIWPGVLLAAQLALAVELPELAPGRWRRAYWSTAAVACAVGLAVQGGHVMYALPRSVTPHPLQRLQVYWPDYSWITPYVHRGDVVVTNDDQASKIVVGYGARTITPGWPDPFLPDQAQRARDLAAIVDPATDPATRQALLAKYHARWVLEIPGSWSISSTQTPVATGPLGQRLYRVPGAAG